MTIHLAYFAVGAVLGLPVGAVAAGFYIRWRRHAVARARSADLSYREAVGDTYDRWYGL